MPLAGRVIIRRLRRSAGAGQKAMNGVDHAAAHFRCMQQKRCTILVEKLNIISSLK
jgi:hypothetical protein